MDGTVRLLKPLFYRHHWALRFRARPCDAPSRPMPQAALGPGGAKGPKTADIAVENGATALRKPAATARSGGGSGSTGACGAGRSGAADGGHGGHGG